MIIYSKVFIEVIALSTCEVLAQIWGFITWGLCILEL